MAGACDEVDPRDDQAIEEHQQRVESLLLPMIVRYEFLEMDQTPEGRAVLDAPRDLRPSLAITALAGPRSGWTAKIYAETERSDHWPADLVRALVRRKIDWDPIAAALALRLVAATDFDDERFQLVLKAADQIAETHPAHLEVMDGLDRLNARAQETADHRYRVPEMRARVIASIARHSPPDLLDLSPIVDNDTWGTPARSILRRANARGVDVRSIIGCLTTAGSSTKPSARWVKAAEPVLAAPTGRDTVKALVELLIDLPADLNDPNPFVAPGNDGIARAAVWSLGLGDVTDDDVEVLRAVAFRCCQANGRPYVTEALCGKASGAAITVLGSLAAGDQDANFAADLALENLWDTVDRGDAIKRIGKELGLDEATIAERVQEMKRIKTANRAIRKRVERGDA